MSEGFDVGLEMSGNAAAFRDMLANMAHGGRIAMLGIPPGGEMAIDWNTVIFNMLTIKGIYGREMYETWYKMTVMLQSGLNIEPVITHRLHYTEFQQGFDAMLLGKTGKVVLDLVRKDTDAETIDTTPMTNAAIPTDGIDSTCAQDRASIKIARNCAACSSASG